MLPRKQANKVKEMNRKANKVVEDGFRLQRRLNKKLR